MTFGYHNNAAIQSVEKLGQTIGGGLREQGEQAVRDARSRIELARDQQEAPVRELASLKAQDEIARRQQGVRVLDIFKDEWNLELATWQPTKSGGKVPRGEPTLLSKFGTLMDAKVNTEKGHKDYGFFVKSDGSRLTQAEVDNKAPQIEALFVANMGIGRTIRMGKEKIERQIQQINQGLKTGQITPEEADAQVADLKAAYDELDAKSANPRAKIEAMEQQKLFLQQFSGPEIEKGIARLDKSIDQQLQLLDKERDRESRSSVAKMQVESRERTAAANRKSAEKIAGEKIASAESINNAKIKASKEISDAELSSTNFKTMAPEARLAHWYAEQINKHAQDDWGKINPAEAWERIQKSKNAKAAFQAYNNFIEANWSPDAAEAAKVEAKARKLFLDNLEPASQKGKTKSWRDVDPNR